MHAVAGSRAIGEMVKAARDRLDLTDLILFFRTGIQTYLYCDIATSIYSVIYKTMQYNYIQYFTHITRLQAEATDIQP